MERLYNLEEVMEVLNAQKRKKYRRDDRYAALSPLEGKAGRARRRSEGWFNFVHLNDGPKEIPDRGDVKELIHTGRDARLYPGEGGIDIAGIMSRLPDVVCSVELPHTERSRVMGYAEHARRCLAYSKKYFEEHNL